MANACVIWDRTEFGIQNELKIVICLMKEENKSWKKYIKRKIYQMHRKDTELGLCDAFGVIIWI